MKNVVVIHDARIPGYKYNEVDQLFGYPAEIARIVLTDKTLSRQYSTGNVFHVFQMHRLESRILSGPLESVV